MDINQSTFLNDRTQNPGLLTTKDLQRRPNADLYVVDDNTESQIGQTYENRHTLICYENTISQPGTILTSHISQPLFSLHPNPKLKQWVRPPFGKAQKGRKAKHLATLKSSKPILRFNLISVESEEESKARDSLSIQSRKSQIKVNYPLPNKSRFLI